MTTPTTPYDNVEDYVNKCNGKRVIKRVLISNNGIGAVKKAVPEMKILASAPSYLRQFSDLFSAGAIEEGLCDGMLFGRMSFANPAFPHQIIKTGRIDASQVCLTCGKCGNLIRAKKPTGCVIRNPKMYLGYYKEFLAENK